MIGLDRNTGKSVEGTAHLAQSIADILSTPIGTRIRRRDYGSLLFQLIDAPLTAVARLQFYAATALALAKWEPRIALERVGIDAAGADGRVDITIEGRRTDLPGADRTELSIPLRLAAYA